MAPERARHKKRRATSKYRSIPRSPVPDFEALATSAPGRHSVVLILIGNCTLMLTVTMLLTRN